MKKKTKNQLSIFIENITEEFSMIGAYDNATNCPFHRIVTTSTH